MTRPKKALPERKSRLISFRLTPEGRSRLEFEAASNGMTLTAYIEAKLDRQLKQIEVRKSDGLHPAVTHELRRIGNNLNQLTHAANAGLTPHHRSLIKTLDGMITLLTEDDTTGPRIRTGHISRTIANDTPPSQKGIELQRGVRLYPARPAEAEQP
jgi:hypothetical protein